MKPQSGYKILWLQSLKRWMYSEQGKLHDEKKPKIQSVTWVGMKAYSCDNVFIYVVITKTNPIDY